MSACDRSNRLRAALLATALCALAACGSDAGSAAADSPATAGAASAPAAAASANASSGGGDASAGAASAGAAAADGIGTRLLSHPDELQMVMLGYRLRGMVPPLAQWAEAQYAVRRANEFGRAAVLESERQRLQGVYDGTAGVGRLRLDVSAQLSQYDAARGGYYLTAFTPGSAFDFSAEPASGARETVRVQVDNEEELNFWPLDAAAAQEVLEKTNGSRSVVLDSRLRITGISQRSGGPTIDARLQRYTIVSTRYGQPTVLGERVFDGAADGAAK